MLQDGLWMGHGLEPSGLNHRALLARAAFSRGTVQGKNKQTNTNLSSFSLPPRVILRSESVFCAYILPQCGCAYGRRGPRAREGSLCGILPAPRVTHGLWAVLALHISRHPTVATRLGRSVPWPQWRYAAQCWLFPPPS